jgi:hypothetical protein
MTIPAAPQIGSTGFIQQPGTAEQVAPLLQALAQRQRLDLARQELAQKQQEWEIQKRVLGTQAEGMELANEQRKREFQAQDEDLVARDQALQLYTGNLPRLGDSKGIGEVLARIKDPAVAAHFYEFVKEGIGLTQAQATASLTGAQATHQTAANTADTATQEILGRFGPQLQTERGQREAIGEVLATAGAEAAGRVASALNMGSGRYGHVVGPDGFLYITDSKTGQVRRDTTVGQRPAQNQEAVRRGAQTLVDLLDEQTAVIERSGLSGSQNPTLAQMAQTGRVLGISTEAVANILRNDPQQLTQMLKTRFAHNYVGLLPHSRSAANLLENLTQSYWAPAGSNPNLLRRAEADRRHLRQIMADLASGKLTDLSRIPGFADAAAAAAAEGQAGPPAAGAAPPNPDDYLQPIR